MEVDKSSRERWSSSSLLQLFIGATIAFGGLVAMLRLSNLWTVMDVEYAEYGVVLFWGLLLVIGALRSR